MCFKIFKFVKFQLSGRKARQLSFHEYVGMDLLRSANIKVARGFVASSADEAFDRSNEYGFKDFVVKAQVLAGGRRKGHFKDGLKSGITFARNPNQVRDAVYGMLGKRLITKQTGEDGLLCKHAYVCERLYPRREFYVALTLDRQSAGPILIGSSSGGINIEETALQNPNSLVKIPIDIYLGLEENTVRDFLQRIDFSQELVNEASQQLISAYKLFMERDLTLLELNPFCETHDGHVFSVDCKLQLDDNAVFRQNSLAEKRDFSQERPLDVRAAEHGINYIALDGSVGCLVNGAGLAMATLDIIHLHGGFPANFLDIGGGATIEQVLTAFEIILSDKNVKAVLVNIFGGIMRCDIIASGIIEAARTLSINIPIVVRLQGTKVEEANLMFLDSKLKIISIDDLETASEMVVKLASIVKIAQEAKIDVQFEMPI